MEGRGGPVTDPLLQFGAVSIGLVHVAGLHRKVFFHSLFPHRRLNLRDEIHQLDRIGAADVVNLERDFRSFAPLTMTLGLFADILRAMFSFILRTAVMVILGIVWYIKHETD